ncbi:hypothetical protein [Streptomyces ortus]|uniref:Secreted protein n=1 Tax=Streptomyces ortus TaxID=2867268 RepID=A0ABT3V2J4_9ACTN|nr:hypothetical protein [Streptomyces ortus]MCX4233988.1 hypothetical protein [Streptomyces ortus]
MALSAVAVLPGTAPRTTRGAAGRRVLQLVLLVGGLFVLGLLCGERAHAAERTGEQLSAPGDSRPVADGAQGLVRPVTDDVVRPVVEGVVQQVPAHVVPQVAEHVVRPVDDLIHQITDGVADDIADGIGEGGVEQPDPPRWWPSEPELPTLPGVPGLPEPPESPGLPLPAVPGQILPAGSAAEPPQPGDVLDQRRAAGKRPSGEHGAAAAYGPRFAGGAGGLAAAGDDLGRQGHAAGARNTRAAGAVQVPVHQMPGGDPTGASACHLAVDNGSPRHGDAQAVTLNERVRPTLVPGAAADVVAAGPRDRHRDIPEFPG